MTDSIQDSTESPVQRAADPVPKLPHREDPRFETELLGKPVLGVVGVYMFRDVLEELCYRGVYAPDRASASLLTGGWFVGPDGRYIEIDGFQDSVPAESSELYLHWLRGNQRLLNDDDVIVLGPCLVRSGSQGRMGPDDLLLFNTFFNLPYHVLLIIDPSADAFGFYLRDEQGEMQNVSVYLIEAIDDLEQGAGPDSQTALADPAITTVPDDPPDTGHDPVDEPTDEGEEDDGDR